MKTAYLIMAHTDAPQLGRLVKALYVEGMTDFYVHIDSKVQMEPFVKAVSEWKVKVRWVIKRQYTVWGGTPKCPLT